MLFRSQLCLDLKSEPGKRSFTFPYSKVLKLSKKTGEFNLTDQEVLDLWMKPRLKGYAEVLGVRLDISDIGPDNKVTVALAA